MSFESDLRVRILESGRKYELLTRFTYKANNGERISVPSGFITDFASIPRLFWNIYPPLGYGKGFNYAKSAILHDYLYANPQGRTRKECDKIFKESMQSVGVYKINIAIFYYFVRLFGRFRFNRK